MGMRATHTSWDEGERMAALKSYHILDTPPEPDFDDVVLLIAKICEVPRAGISLIDDHRQWFKAEIGLGFKETPLDVSICPGLALEPGLTVIPDARADKRLASNRLVTGEPHIRFYAGVRLETSEGPPRDLLRAGRRGSGLQRDPEICPSDPRPPGDGLAGATSCSRPAR